MVDWAERAMMDADFDEGDSEILSDIISRLGGRRCRRIRIALAGLRRIPSSARLQDESDRVE